MKFVEAPYSPPFFFSFVLSKCELLILIYDNGIYIPQYNNTRELKRCIMNHTCLVF